MVWLWSYHDEEEKVVLFIAYYYPQGFQSYVPGQYPLLFERGIFAKPVNQHGPSTFIS
jgi:hypothetical protein